MASPMAALRGWWRWRFVVGLACYVSVAIVTPPQQQRKGHHRSFFAFAAAVDIDLDDEALFADLDTDGGVDGDVGLGLDLDLDNDGGGYAFDEEDDGDLEEYSFESPDAVHAAWKSALEELKEQAHESNERLHEQYREMQKKVSNGEMTKDEMKQRREELEKEAEERSGVPMACQQGRQSCLHAENSPLADRAVTEAKAHMTFRETNEHSALRAALLPSLAMPDVVIGTLPRPPPKESGGDGNADDGGIPGDDDSATELDPSIVNDPEAFALLAPGVQSYLTSVATVQDVQNGAIVNTGALPFNVSEWEELASESRERKDKRTCVVVGFPVVSSIGGWWMGGWAGCRF